MPITIVLVRPLFSGNLGSVARAMKNMGLKELFLIEPEALPRDSEAKKMAAHAKDVLHEAKIFPELKTALQDFDLVVGTSRRKGKERSNWTTPREFGKLSREISAEKRIAILFGPEDSGLSNEEVALCQKIVEIPSHPDFPSLNLAQAVMVMAYECFTAQLATDAQASPQKAAKSAKIESLENLYEDLGELLLEIGFLREENPKHLMRLLRHFFNRAQPTEKEVKIFRGIFRQLRWWKQQGPSQAE